jgi:branched-chain amino acid transport system permease protein
MISFGHAAYLGLGAYAAALSVRHLGLPMEINLLLAPLAGAAGAILFGWFCVRLSGVYLAMLTLAFAQILWSVAFQWVPVTGGDNGILGVWPSAWAGDPTHYYLLCLAVAGIAVAGIRHIVFSPFGLVLRAVRDAPRRAEASGIDTRKHRWFAFALAGCFAGLAGGFYAYLKGSVFPEALSIPQSVEALVMVLLGGVQTLSGPLVGAAAYIGLKTELVTLTNSWRLVIGLLILAAVIAFPRGLVGTARTLWEQRR